VKPLVVLSSSFLFYFLWLVHILSLMVSYETPASSTVPRLHRAEKLECIVKILSLTDSAVGVNQHNLFDSAGNPLSPRRFFNCKRWISQSVAILGGGQGYLGPSWVNWRWHIHNTGQPKRNKDVVFC
jgi:hypothetical protein